MKDRDDKLLGEAYEEINEGLFDRMKARKGTYGQKALSGITKAAGAGLEKLAGQGTSRMAQHARMTGKGLKAIGKGGEQDVQEQRAGQLMQIYTQKLDKMYESMKNDASKMGVDLDRIANMDVASKGQGGAYPKLAGLSKFLRTINEARGIFGGK